MLELSRVIQQLPPAQLSRVQTLMHNMMAGFDVRKEMEEFEKSLPPGFRDKLMGLMGNQGISPVGFPQTSSETVIEVTPVNDVRDARLTLLRAVASGSLSPEDAERVLFPVT